MPSDLENYLTLLQAENKANDNKNDNSNCGWAL